MYTRTGFFSENPRRFFGEVTQMRHEPREYVCTILFPLGTKFPENKNITNLHKRYEMSLFRTNYCSSRKKLL